MNKKKLSKKRNKEMRRTKKEAVLFNRLSAEFSNVSVVRSYASQNVHVHIRGTCYTFSNNRKADEIIEIIKLDILLGAT